MHENLLILLTLLSYSCLANLMLIPTTVSSGLLPTVSDSPANRFLLTETPPKPKQITLKNFKKQTKNLTIRQMIKKYSVLICIAISAILIVTATLLYPGGSLFDKNSTGFDWTKNFISNLFAEKAINGSENPSRIWALTGVVFHSVGFGLFFMNMSKKMPSRHASNVLKYVGIFIILFNFLITTPLHDPMITISSTLSLLGLFYVTVFILKTRLHLFKFFCIIGLLIFYSTLFLYGSGNWVLLAIMQKVSFISLMLLILGLEYFTKLEDFNHISS